MTFSDRRTDSDRQAEQAWAARFTDPAGADAWVQASLPDLTLRPCAQVVLGFLRWRAGELVGALDQVMQAEVTLRERGDERWLARALSMLAVLAGESGQAERALRLLQEQLELVRRLGDVEMQASAYNDFGVQIGWDDPERALTYYQRAFDLLEERALSGGASPHPGIHGIAALNIAEIHLLRGRDAEGEAMTGRGGELLEQARAWTFWPGYVTLRVKLLSRQGHLDDARQLIRDAFARLGERLDPRGPPLTEPAQLLHAAAAHLEFEAGDPQRALEWLAGLEDWPNVRPELVPEFLDLRARIEAAGGDHAAAYRTARQLLAVTEARHAAERDTQVKQLEVLHRTELAVQQTREAQRAAQHLREHLRELQVLRGELEKLSSTDDLTGLGNRRQFEQHRAQLEPGDAVLLIDIDHFKRVNDTFGHAAGDVTLQVVAARVRGVLRRSDRAYRYGGEEFTVLLRGVGEPFLLEVSERIRQAVVAGPVPGPGVTVTVSIGAALLTGVNDPGALERADQALYHAKQQGRNRTCLARPEGAAGPVPG
ncbi:GGDEF domain-containing protein [Deinococcus sp. 12RED42]|uniref:diguanylate cyclase n=1 Tax=Deinococcus sp. 12RED42 TaxID=2745872 RepID=UPI001E491105|nr:GGDEF domain-containing protein [Deinococcus sp. 12RED42]